MEQPLSEGLPIERRRHVRMLTSLPARLLASQGRVFDGIVKDHCPGGVFVELDDNALELFKAFTGTAPEGLRLTLEIRSSGGDENSVLHIPTRIARLQGSGVGMAFDDAPPDLLATLASAAVDARPEPLTNPGLGVPAMSAAERGKLTSSMREMVQAFLEARSADVFDHARELLFVDARDATSNAEQQALLDAMKELDSLKPSVTAVFLDEILRQIDGLAEGRTPGVSIQDGEAHGGLELVDTGSFDDWLTVKAIIERDEKNSGRDEEILAYRLSVALGMPVDADNNPSGMRSMSFTFHDSMQNLGAGKRARNAAYVSFEERLVGSLPGLRAQLERLLPQVPIFRAEIVRSGGSSVPPPSAHSSRARDRLVQGRSPSIGEAEVASGRYSGGKGVQDPATKRSGAVRSLDPAPGGIERGQSRASPVQSAGAARHPHSLPVDSTLPTAAQSAGSLYGQRLDAAVESPISGAVVGGNRDYPVAGSSGPAGGPIAPPGTSRSDGGPLAAGMMQARDRETIGDGLPEGRSGLNWNRVSPAADWRAAPGELTGQLSSAGRVRVSGHFSQAWQAARNLTALRRQLLDQHAPVGVNSEALAEGPETVSDPHVLEQLDELARSSEVSFARRGGGNKFRSRVRRALGDDNAQPGSKAGDALDVVSALLDALMDDVLISGEAKRRIGQLAVPLLHTAFTEEGFLGSPDHPAREVVDRIGRLDLQRVGSNVGEPAADLVDSIVSDIITRYVHEPGVFSEVLPALDAMVAYQEQDYRENLAQLVAAREKQESVVKSLREGAQGEAADDTRAAGQDALEDMPGEWREYLLLAKNMPLGQLVTLDPGTSREQAASLAWRADDNSQFLFADLRGNKAATFSMQEFAMGLRRGQVVVADDAGMGPVERGVFRMLHDMHKAVAHESTHDALTGLPNVKQFREALKDALKAMRQGVACFVMVDCVDEVVHRCGQGAADKLATQIARLLEKHMGDRGLVTRASEACYGLLYSDAVVQDVQPLLERLRVAVETARCVFGRETIGLSISIAVMPLGRGVGDAESIITTLTRLVGEARTGGGNRIVLVAGNSEEEVGSEADLASTSLAELLAEGRLVLRSQLVKPVTETNGSKPYFEILLGRYDDEGQIQAAGKLFQTADGETARAADQWVVANTLDWMRSNRRVLSKLGGIAINLSPDVIGDPAMLDFVVSEFIRTDVPPGKVMFELAESSAVEQLTVVQEFMRSLREFGCRFSLDDFRAGQASFAYLKNLPVDRVKIDGALVRDVTVGDQECAMVRSVNEIAHFMGKETIAELVDDPAILEKLVELGVDHAQGYCIQRPIPLADLVEKLDSGAIF